MSGTARRLAEAANQIVNPQPIAEAFKNGDKVKVPHKGKMVSGRIIRYDDGGTSRAQQHGGGYVVDVGEPASIFVTKEKIQKEEVVAEDVLPMRVKGGPIKTDRRLVNDAFLDAVEKAYKSGGLKGRLQGLKSLGLMDSTTVEDILDSFKSYFNGASSGEKKVMAAELKKILKPEDYAKFKTRIESVEFAGNDISEAEWKSLKKTKVDLNALRQQGYKISVQHGEGDTLYKIIKKPGK